MSEDTDRASLLLDLNYELSVGCQTKQALHCNVI